MSTSLIENGNADLKRILKSPPPNELTEYAKNNQSEKWASFCNHNSSLDYKALRRRIFSDQGGLCGYCEKQVSSLPDHLQRVEHYHSKSDNSSSHNWDLDWGNVFGVCNGGGNADKEKHPLPDNLSCDSYKDHLIQKKQLPKACEGYYLNPLRIINTANLFTFDMATGELGVNQGACEGLADIENQCSTLVELVEETIKVLNLNYQRLCDDRIEIRNEWNRQLKRARESNDREFHKKLAERWFSERWPSFFTTRRTLLGKHAEAYLDSINYSG